MAAALDSYPEASESQVPVVLVTGLTASGKSKLALQLARRLGGQIICADSVALYQGFDIGSAKPSRQDRSSVVHHGMDLLRPSESADVGWYRGKMLPLIHKLRRQGVIPVIVGGSGLYIRALLGRDFHNLPTSPVLRQELCSLPAEKLYRELLQRDPQRAAEIHPHDHFRLARACEVARLTQKTMAQLTEQKPENTCDLDQRFLFRVVILPPQQQMLDFVQKRSAAMLAAGLVAEVEDLLRQGVSTAARPMQSVGYRQTLLHIQGQAQRPLLESIIISTRQLARKQRQWLRPQHFHHTLTNADQPSATSDLIKALSQRFPHARF